MKKNSKGYGSNSMPCAGGQIKDQRSNDPKMYDKIAASNAQKLQKQKVKH